MTGQPGATGTLARRLAFEQRHPEIEIIPPGRTRTGQWEAAWPGQGSDERTRHRTCPGLLAQLEARFDPGCDPGAVDERGECE